MKALSVEPDDPWARPTSRIRENLEMLAHQIAAAKPGAVFRITTSKNDLKPLHIVMSIGYPAAVDHQLVFSVMFSRMDGPFMRHCDLMRESGPILLELPDQNLGVAPTRSEVEVSAEQVIVFAKECRAAILAALN